MIWVALGSGAGGLTIGIASMVLWHRYAARIIWTILSRGDRP
ncbi:hypothetical protein ACFVR6_03740 [Microbacterium sp. NPDC058021]